MVTRILRRLYDVRSTVHIRDSARVLAWRCPRCNAWVPPRAFNVFTGTCRPCNRNGGV